MTMRPETRPRVVAPAAFAALVLAAAASAGAAAAEAPLSTDVLVEDFVFQPEAVTVGVGGTVTWTLGSDPDQHTVTPRDPEQFEDSGQLFEGDTYAVTFDEPGTVDYFCRLHPTMTGTVTVVAAPSPTATPAPTEAATRSTTPTAAPVTASPPATPTGTPAPATPPAEEPAAFLLPLAIAGAFAVAIVVALDWMRRRRA